MKKLSLAALLVAAGLAIAYAQTTTIVNNGPGSGGGFTDQTTATPITATTSGVSGSLPSNSPVVVATNVGANGAYCKLGATATTADQYITPSGGWFAFAVLTNTQLTCLTASGTTSINMTGGSGFPTGTGGSGGGGGGGGAVTVADGADVTQGAIADTAASPGGTGTVSAKLREMTALLNSILSGVNAPIPTGTNQIGGVTTTPGARTLVTLDVKTVTTGGTAVAALTTGHKTAGGWIQNPPNATVNLCINEIGTASGTTSSGDTTCIIPGQTYNLIASGGAVSVIASDSSHAYSGYGLQ